MTKNWAASERGRTRMESSYPPHKCMVTLSIAILGETLVCSSCMREFRTDSKP